MVAAGLLALALASCAPNQEKEKARLRPMIARLGALDAAGEQPSPAFADSAKRAFVAYVDEFPKDEFAGKLLLRAATLAKGREAIGLYRRAALADEKVGPIAMMTVGYIYDTELEMQDSAMDAYAKLVQWFPKSPQAVEARAMIERYASGMTDEQFIEQQLRSLDSAKGGVVGGVRGQPAAPDTSLKPRK